jgi:hypothetical protein
MIVRSTVSTTKAIERWRISVRDVETRGTGGAAGVQL